MTTKIQMLAIALLMASSVLSSCGPDSGKGDRRDRNLERATLVHLDSISAVEYIGLTDTRELDADKFQAVVIYCVTDSAGIRTEYNARVTANGDASEIFTWEDLESRVLSDAKQKITDKMEEKGLPLDGSLVDALIELKKQMR